MAGRRGLFVRKDTTAGTGPQDARLALAGLLTPAGALGVVPGVLSGCAVTGTSGWAYEVSAGHYVTTRGASDGAVLAAVDGPTATDVGAVGVAPASGSRWDLIWVRQRDVDAGDSDSQSVVGVTSGTSGGSPSKPYGSVPAGALVLAEAQVATGATQTSHANVTITNVAPAVAARGGIIPVPNVTVRSALAAASEPTLARPLYVHRSDADALGRLEVSTNGTTWRTYTATPSMPAPRTTAANGSATASGNLIRDDVLGAFTFSAVEGYVYRVAIDNVLINGGVAGDVYSVQLRIAPGASAPGGSSPLVAATQVTTPLAGSSGRQSADLGGPWVCESSGTYSVAFFLMRALGTGPGTPVSAGMSRALYAHLLYKKED